MINRAFEIQINHVDRIADVKLFALAGLLAHFTAKYGKSCKVTAF